jgi:hypothetical protein
MGEAARAIEEIAERFVSGELSVQDEPRLVEGLRAGEIFGGNVAGALLVHGLLVARCMDVDAGVAAVMKRIRRSEAVRRPTHRRVAWMAALAATVLLAAGLTIFIVLRGEPGRPIARLAEGELVGVDGGTIAAGQVVDSGGARAALVCPDGSRIELEPHSRASLDGPVDGDRWRIALLTGGVECDVPESTGAVRVRTSVGDVITAGTRFGVRVDEPTDGVGGLLVRVFEGAVRVERVARRTVRVETGTVRVFPAALDSTDARRGLLQLLFGGEPVTDVVAKFENGLLEVEGRIGAHGVGAEVAADGVVVRYAREYARGEVPDVLPEAVRRAVEAKYGPDVRWIEAEIGFRGTAPDYEAEIRVGRRTIEVRIDAEGRVTEIQD